MLEISKVLTMSTAHISETTRNLLDAEPEANNMGLCVYEKSTYGWFIYVGKNNIEHAMNIPSDLQACIDLAQQNECDILCLDCDAETVDGLPEYD